MRRSGSAAQRNMRAPSPTNTTYSGISNYKTESYRPLGAGPAASSGTDARSIARTHFEELHRYLASYLAKEPANSRSTARQKLTRLTRQQFQELSTDVYDELIRRKTNTTDNEVPFLPVRDDFHPKRNQARQKLATLPTGRFKDLSSDVYYELGRRYPEFKEEVPPITPAMPSPGSNYDEYPSPGQNAQYDNVPTGRRTSEDRAVDSGYGASSPVPVRKSNDEYGSVRGSQDGYGADPYGSRRRPSQDTSGRRSVDRDGLGRRPSQSVSVHSDSTSTTNAQSATAGMIIPNKSTIAEEEIEVPYGRELRESTGTERDRSRERTDTEGETDDMRSPAPGIGGLSGLTARLQIDEEEEEAVASTRNNDDYYEKMSFGRASVTSDRSAGRMASGRASVGGEDEKIRREYEYKIATMQSRITGLERDLEDAMHGDERVQLMEAELEELRRRVEEKTSSMRALQQELDQLREESAREKEMAARRAREDEEELQVLRERLEAGGGGGVDPEILDQLRSDMEGLMTELSDLSKRNDELMTAKDSDLVVIRDLDTQLKEYKRKYEQAKTELRSMKATSQLFLQPPKTDDQLPVSPDGGLLDIHVTAFVSSIDSLLTAGRSPQPTRVLTPMKSVVNAVTAIIEDVRVFERRPARERAEVDLEALQALRDRAEATLSNLVTAAKSHATGAGMSPVSLLDAAASHVSFTVTEIGKTVCIRRATRAEQERFAPASPPPSASSPAASPYGTLRSGHGRAGSSTSTRSDRLADLASSPPRSSLGRSSLERPSSASNGSSMFEGNNGTGDESAPTEGPEDAWTELKPYLEAQTESIVYAIQSVLSAVRSPTPSPSLNENLTHIITIVSSIVAVCKDNLPPASAEQGGEILRELSEHANKLSEVQALPEVTKESRQVMAKSSFAVANAMKGLMKL
ncbi:hypothetical protein PsYK624_074900 [Phanerochaete sordida]|uniref:GIT Spa2 homology (SHD) domain-containing protein n=1 Tax=Phanerochaete sordida TaxID=48140 RepID=A0A9P3GAK3_9APHY|nr:hypothetical protein PsYK624_074900 [Phanerochaete sordida]